jgi:drug/metabolite transporter (DMT)-like permease
MLALICIYALPDRSSQPLLGVYFFWGGAIALSAFLFMLWKKQREIVQESISDKIIRWLVSIFSMFFAFNGIVLTLICFYSLPTNTPQPQIGVLYFLGSVIIIFSYIVIIYRGYISKKPYRDRE